MKAHRTILLLCSVMMLAGCRSEPEPSGPERDPLLRGFGPVVAWRSGSITLHPPDEVEYSRAVQVDGIEEELATIRTLPCDCDGVWTSMVHRRLKDPEEPEQWVFSEWVLICVPCNQVIQVSYRVRSEPTRYDEYFIRGQQPSRTSGTDQ